MSDRLTPADVMVRRDGSVVCRRTGALIGVVEQGVAGWRRHRARDYTPDRFKRWSIYGSYTRKSAVAQLLDEVNDQHR